MEPLAGATVAALLGDSNLSPFRAPGCRVFALPNGRLSALRSFLRLSLPQTPDAAVLKVFLCLSLLDRGNRLISLTSCAKSTLSLCHRLFPSAQLFVVLCGVPCDFSQQQRVTHQEFAAFLRTKHPSSCVVLSAPVPFIASGSVWSPATRSSVFASIRRHLN